MPEILSFLSATHQFFWHFLAIIAKSPAMKYSCLFVFLFVAISTQVIAQVRGKVTDALSGSALPGAHVFLDGTQEGTTTDDNGEFELRKTPFRNASLVISFVGYENKVVQLDDAAGHDLVIQLKPASLNLAAAEVKASTSGKRKRRLRQFRKDFLGASNYASKCTILNPEVLRFEEKDGFMLATAKQLLEIENMATGYRVHFLLEHFRSNGATVSYAGKALFTPLHSDDEKTKRKWEENRQKIWQASKRRFLLSLVHNRLARDGYSVQAGRITPENEFEPAKRIVETADLVEPKSGGLFMVRMPLVLRVANGIDRPAEKDLLASVNLGKDHETNQSGHDLGREEARFSFLVATKPTVEISEYGMITRPELVQEFGLFASQRIAEMLPLEYGLDDYLEEIQVPEINGFKLSNLRIPLDQIKSGGPPRDGIPSIDHPRFANAGEAAFIFDEDWVLGVEYNFVAKAYPVKILNWHEIVNDRFAGEVVVITWCPLCGSGMAFKGKDSSGSVRQFGVSGLLYNSDVLMYDRQSESLWSQVMAMAVAGPASGNELEMLPTELCTWDSWNARHPDTKVLTTETGFERDYTRDPYSDYLATDRLMFAVAAESEALPPKARVLGVEISGRYKAYPLDLLKKKKTVTDEFAGKKLTLKWDEKARAPHLTVDGKPWPAVNLFWFAWYAFHPETEVMKQ
ncbi:MAG: DUF3179 domain-containing protein [Gammaproteobacteria bacterium]|nr:MAG: DUF3179 domain-containing protein [Gammaproteobacteria bacterium]